jgi:hypothetical protein
VTGDEKGNRSSAIAAAVILLVTGLAFFFLPGVMISLGSVSPWLAAALGTALVLAFFLLFWLRARHQRRRGR